MKEQLIIKLNNVVTTKTLEKYKQYLEKGGIKNVLFVPAYMDIVQNDSEGYRIFTKESYKEYVLSNMKACNISKESIKVIEERWDNISKGHNFIIGVGKNDLMFYSVEYFDKEVLCNGTA